MMVVDTFMWQSAYDRVSQMKKKPLKLKQISTEWFDWKYFKTLIFLNYVNSFYLLFHKMYKMRSSVMLRLNV